MVGLDLESELLVDADRVQVEVLVRQLNFEKCNMNIVVVFGLI